MSETEERFSPAGAGERQERRPKSLFPADQPAVCVMAISWNGKEHLRECLRSVVRQDYGRYDVWALDNASTDGTAEMVREEFPSVRVLRNEKNLGFTGAANAGIARACKENYPYILLLANDIVLDPRSLSAAVATAQARPEAGMIGFRMVGATSYAPMEEFEETARRWTSLEVQATDWVEGAAFLARPEVIQRIGAYDELLFMYGDENDLEARLVSAGYVLLKTNIPVWHNCGRNVMGKRKLSAAFYAFRNHLILLTKQKPWKVCLRRTLGLIRLACSPLEKVSSDDIVRKRYRPSNVFVNGVVVFAAILSYALKFGKILRTRREHRKLAECERAHFVNRRYS